MKISPKLLKKAFPYWGIEDLSSFAIVKEFIGSKTQPEDIEDVLQGLQKLHDMSISTTDCYPRNYKGSKLVDLGQAWILPYQNPNKCFSEEVTASNQYIVRRWEWNGSRMIDTFE